MKKMNHSWGTVQRLASDRPGLGMCCARISTLITKVAIHNLSRAVEVEVKTMNHSLGTRSIQRLASDRQGWRSCIAALYMPAGVTGSK